MNTVGVMNRHAAFSGPQSSRGFTYLGVLFLLALFGMTMMALSTNWAIESRRSKEQELLAIGREIKQAIGNYYESNLSGLKTYPKSLTDLLEDKRYIGTRRYLRKIPLDPMTNQIYWGIIYAPDGGIMGVYSTSTKTPINKANFALGEEEFKRAETYQQWRFVYIVTPQKKMP